MPVRPSFPSVRLAERPSFLTVGTIRLVLLCGVIVGIGMIPGRLTPHTAGWIALGGLVGIPLAIAVPFLAAVRALARRLPLATAALRAVNDLGLVGLGAAFFLVWTFVYVGLWWRHPHEAFTGLAAAPRFADFFYYAVSTAFISPPGDILGHSRGVRSATMIEMLTGFALLAVYLSSFVDWQRRDPYRNNRHVLVERSMHPDYLSNAYLVADEPGGTAVFVDSGAPLAPLVEAVEREGLTVTHVLTTHGHHDHVEGHPELQRRYGVPAVAEGLETGGLRIEALPTPGHSDDGVSFVVNGELCFSGDTLFRDAVGGSRDDFEGVRRSVMEVLMALPPETRVLPGHTDETTIGREWEHNPFVRVWRGDDPEGSDPCRVAGEAATLVVWSPDYDGKGKAWVRFADGRDAIVGGSRVERL